MCTSCSELQHGWPETSVLLAEGCLWRWLFLPFNNITKQVGQAKRPASLAACQGLGEFPCPLSTAYDMPGWQRATCIILCMVHRGSAKLGKHHATALDSYFQSEGYNCQPQSGNVHIVGTMLRACRSNCQQPCNRLPRLFTQPSCNCDLGAS